MQVVTLKERRAAKIARLDQAVATLRISLASRARELGGRYVLFGSASRGTMHPESDVDLLLDFPTEDATSEAWEFAERECSRLELECDARPRGWCSEAFLAHVLPNGVVLA